MSSNDLEPKETKEADAGPHKEIIKERRAFRRRGCRAKVYYQTDQLGMTPLIEAAPMNVSEDGICFKTATPLAPKALLFIEVHHASLRKQIKTQAEVVWAKRLDEKYCLVGCRWKRRLHSSELHQFL